MILLNPNEKKIQKANQQTLHSPAKNRPKSLIFSNSNKPKVKELKNMSFECIEENEVRSQNINQEKISNHCNEYFHEEAYEIEQLRHKMDFCARYMSQNLEIIQSYVNSRYKNQFNTDNDSSSENVLISLAKLKKIRDILKGTIAFENSLN